MSGAARLAGRAVAVFESVLDSTRHRTITGVPMRERSMVAGLLGEMLRAIDIARQY
jgi:hypothetical protein